jgi:hypothetical protein
MSTWLTHRTIYYSGLLLLAASLPLSIFTTSIALMVLVINWLVEGDFRNKLRMLRSRKSVGFIAALYGLHLVGLLTTSDFVYGFHDLKIKLPILLLPLVTATSQPVPLNRLRSVLLVFIGGVALSSFTSLFVFLGIIPIEFTDVRQISIFVSHIRLALMTDLSIFILVWICLPFSGKFQLSGRYCVIMLPLVGWFVFFLVLLQSITGLLILLIPGLIMLWILSGKITDVAPRFIFRALIIAVPLIISSYLAKSAGRYYYREPVDFSSLEPLSPQGNPYVHDTLSRAAENGNYVWLYLAEDELRECWNRRSSYTYDGPDKRNQEIKYTLIRYLTSRGYRKDCEGVNLLTAEDVEAIESGCSNHIFTGGYSLYPRIYQVIWEIDNYRGGGNPAGHSVAQRIYFLELAREILRENPVFGVGTGDVQAAYNRKYDASEHHFEQKFRRRAHNQYVTFLITFGVAGFLVAMLAFFVPVFLERKWSDFLFVAFFTVGMLSMLTEDTLETHTGVSFFMFFYSLLLFGRERVEG